MKKNVLLTNLFIAQYTGSELDTLQKAGWFADNGWDVEVVTLFKSDPLMRLFKEKNIKVTSIFEEKISRNYYDLLWGHHWPVINNILYNRLAEFRKVVHYCLGTLEPLESAVPYHEEIPLYIANSQGTKDNLVALDGVHENKIIICPNAVDEIYFEKYTPLQKQKLKKAAVVSNHVTDEMELVKDYLAVSGIDVDYIGISHKYQLVDVGLLKSYDLIVTIGRTVQMCFACGVPVFCYDYFGGPGYIDKANIDIAEQNNYSGRGFCLRNDAKALAEEIRVNYDKALWNMEYLNAAAKERYRLNKSMADIISRMESIPDYKNPDLLIKYSRYKRPNEAYIGNWFKMMKLDCELQNAKNTIISLKEELCREKDLSSSLSKTVREILNSRSYKLGHSLVKFIKLLVKPFYKRSIAKTHHGLEN